MKWIVVDGTGPVPMEVLSPRPMAILGGENHEVRVVMQELGGLDLQSLELVWVVEDYETGDLIRNGREPLSLEGEVLEGLQLELFADMNLSSITNEMLIDRMVVKISIDGRDLAGNDVTGLEGQSANLVVATWNMEWLQPKFELKPSAMTYSRLLMDVETKHRFSLRLKTPGPWPAPRRSSLNPFASMGRGSSFIAPRLKPRQAASVLSRWIGGQRKPAYNG